MQLLFIELFLKALNLIPTDERRNLEVQTDDNGKKATIDIKKN
jgi:hypothetical protein